MVRLKVGLLNQALAKREGQFQFHNGSIKSMSFFSENLYEQLCFNSTMVRLKEVLDINGNVITEAFQFHNGSIKSKRDLVKNHKDSRVSIPQWFD